MEILEKAIEIVPKVQAITGEVLARHIRRHDIVSAAWLSLVSRHPAFFLGSPGIDKTGTVQALANRIDGAVFYDALMPTIVSVEQLLVESTLIEEIPAENGGKLIRTKDTLGAAAGAHIIFADEIWKSEPRLLQTLLDLAKGDGVRHEGGMVKTPLLSFLAASNELPDPEGNLGAVWSRMTIRVLMDALDRAGKTELVSARLHRDRTERSGESAAKLKLDEVVTLRSARPHVEISDEIVATVLDIYQDLVDESFDEFSWAWQDDRRFGRVFDVMQAHALLDARVVVGKQDLRVLEFMLWDKPEHIGIIKKKIAPYCRTPLTEAQELVDSLLVPSGTVRLVLNGDRVKGVQALTQVEACMEELKRLESNGGDGAMRSAISDLIRQVQEAKAEVIAIVTGMKKGGA